MIDKFCTVCGYEMDDGPRYFNICPSCGTEFGLHDKNATIEELRSYWLMNESPWCSTVIPKPFDWNPIKQLQNLTSY